MTKPARLLLQKTHSAFVSEQWGQCVVRESEEERASETADEFYPQNKVPAQPVDATLCTQLVRQYFP
jgi:hypothetical protein